MCGAFSLLGFPQEAEVVVTYKGKGGNDMKKVFAMILSAALIAGGSLSCMAAEALAQDLPDIFSVGYGEAFDGPAALTEEGAVYISDALRGASAIYISGAEETFDDVFIYGAGFSTEEDLSAERSSQYGFCADVLVNGAGSSVTLNNPTIFSDPESYANGVFAAAMARAYINGGTIQDLIDLGATATEDAHLVGIGETHLTKFIVSDLVHTIFGNADLHPLAGGKFGCGRIHRSVKCAGIRKAQNGHDCHAREL